MKLRLISLLAALAALAGGAALEAGWQQPTTPWTGQVIRDGDLSVTGYARDALPDSAPARRIIGLTDDVGGLCHYTDQRNDGPQQWVCTNDAGIDVRDLGAVGDGRDDRAAIVLADAAAGGLKPLLFAAGTYVVGSNLTIASPVIMLPGAMLSPSSGVTVTFGGALSAPLAQIFTGAGTIAVGKVAEIYPQWWGAKGDGTTNDTAAIQAAIAAASAAGGGVVFFPFATYATTGVTVTSNYVVLRGSPATIKLTTTGGTAVTFSAATGVRREEVGMSGIKLTMTQNWDGVDGGAVGLKLVNVQRGRFEAVTIENFTYGLEMVGDGQGVVYNDIDFQRMTRNKVGVYLRQINGGWTNQNTFRNGSFSGATSPNTGVKHIYLTATALGFNNANNWLNIALEGGPEYGLDMGANVDDQNFFGCRIENLPSTVRGVRSAGTNISFFGGFFSNTDVDMEIASGAGPHNFYGSYIAAGSPDIIDANIPTVARSFGGTYTNSANVVDAWGGNLVANARFRYFETDANFGNVPSSWVHSYSTLGGGAAVTKETVELKEGAASYKVVNTGVTNFRVGQSIDLVQNRTYTVRLLYRSTAPASGDVRLRVGSSLSLNESLNVALTADDTWREIRRTFTATTSPMYVYVYWNTPSAFTTYLAGVIVMPGSGTGAFMSDRPIPEAGGEIYGQLKSRLGTGAAPFPVDSTTKNTNFNADALDGSDWAAPPTIGSGTPGSAIFTSATIDSQNLTAVLFAALGTPVNGTIRYCSDCTKATPCGGGGAGALAKRLAGAWDCD